MVMAARLHSDVERQVRSMVKAASDAGASYEQVTALERSTRERLSADANAVLGRAEAKAAAEEEAERSRF